MAFDVTLSGVNAALTQLRVTAHNTANLATPGFTPLRAELSEASHADGGPAGVQVSSVRRTEEPRAADAPSQVDPAAELVNMISAQRSVEANVRMIRAEDETQQSLTELRD